MRANWSWLNGLWQQFVFIYVCTEIKIKQATQLEHMVRYEYHFRY